jgi:hypothetical protein
MKTFVYKITKHPAEAFNEVVYFCSETGDCTLDQIPLDQTEALENILNGEGAAGWELIQLAFSRKGVMAFWKKEQRS